MRTRNYERYVGTDEVITYPSIDDFIEADNVTGLNNIKYRGLNLDVLVEDNESETTVVYFHAAIAKDNATIPVFNGLNLNSSVGANAIYVSDPVLESDLTLGWYAGDEDHHLQEDLVRVFQKILGQLPPHRHLIFFGASGGGFASLYFSSQFDDSLAIAINPQTNVLRYFDTFVDPFLEKLWPNFSESHPGFAYDTGEIYSRRFKNSVLYIQNLGDRSHVRSHLIPFLEDINPEDERFMLHFVRWGKGHRAAGSLVLIPLLRTAISCRGEWGHIREKLTLSKEFNPESIDSASTKYIFEMIREEKK